ncbi:radiation-inducible immediate-early gene IEX-1 isoform X2 [Cyanistes caeruleus]|uniref:radiation-inducible immediate-early gene IEX-1 isoform X2 n=1 Tax=Cyanistes caeruleus TaxID=156563 RepID=UPI000CDA3FE4|nr:radiation-inducible immediate-early gene IEX-1 isoform X2 [Cyanistes caeruleus]
MSMVAAAAATAACPGRFWGHPESVPKGVAPSPPRHFTFEPLPARPGPSRPRRRHRRVLYPPAVRRPLPSEEPSAAKRLLVLLLAVVGTQIYNAPGDVGVTDVITDVTETPLGTPRTLPIPEEPQIPAGNAGIANGTTPVAPVGGSCPSLSKSSGSEGDTDVGIRKLSHPSLALGALGKGVEPWIFPSLH